MEERHYFDLRTPREFLELMRQKARQTQPGAAAFVYNCACGEHGDWHSITWEDSVTREHKTLSARNRVELMLKVRRMAESAVVISDVAQRTEES